MRLALLLMLASLYGTSDASILATGRLKTKNESNEEVKGSQTLQPRSGSMLADLLNSGRIREESKTASKKQIVAGLQLSNNANVSTLQREIQHVVEFDVHQSEKHGHLVKRLAEPETKTEVECKLKVANGSVLKFYNRILYDKASAFTLNLTFPKFTNKSCVTSKSGIILPFQWIWVYRETLTFLSMPRSASIWSLGLLNLYYVNGPLEIEIEPEVPGICEDMQLEIGATASDLMIGHALGEMMRGLAMKYLRYNTSHWCYMNITYESESDISRTLDNNFFSVSPILQFVCCSYDLELESDMHVKCQDVHKYDSVWWGVPLGLGILMWLYFPLLFMKVNGKIHKEIKKSSIGNEEVDGSIVTVQVNAPVTNPANESNNSKDSIVFNDGKSPITAFSMVKSSVSKLVPQKRKNKSRIAIFVYSILTLIIPGIEVLIHFFFLLDYVQSLADNNISFGFLSVLAGWDKSKNCKLSIFGGPIIALSVYLVVCWILLLSPKVLANQIYRGVCDSSENTKSILCISLAKKEKLGSTAIRKHRNGYLRLTKLQVCHLYMLIDTDYWKLTRTLIKERYCQFSSALKSRLPVALLRFIILCFCLPFYALFCVTEIIAGFLYYASPMFSLLFCFTVGLSLGINTYVSVKIVPRFPRLGLIIRYPACVIVFLMLIYHLYIFTVLFIDSFFFLSRILLFTYTSVVAYPRETYGYFMLILLSVYFGLKGLFQFGNIYKRILKLTIKLCKRDEILREYVIRNQEPDGNEVCGIPKEMFEFLVDHIRPRRVHIFHSVIRLVFMIFILTISIVLIDRFEKFEDISLFVHIFITLFICALPTIYNSLSSKQEKKQKLTRKLKKYLQSWILVHNQSSNDVSPKS